MNTSLPGNEHRDGLAAKPSLEQLQLFFMALPPLLTTALVLAACNHIAPFDLRDTNSGSSDADHIVDTGTDADADTDAPMEADVNPNIDADVEEDSEPDVEYDREADAEIDVEPPTCSPPQVGRLIALYTFDDGTGDSVGDHHIRLSDGAGCIESPVRGEGCGRCMAFRPDCTASLGRIPDSSDWDEVRSIDFWYRSASSDMAGILSRDASGPNVGDFTFFRFGGGRIALRVQHPGTNPDDVIGRQTIICSNAPIAEGVWVHVGINLGTSGATELWIDGLPQSGAGEIHPSWDIECGHGRGEVHDLALSNNPWVIGAATWDSEPGEGTPSFFLHHGRIDHLRFTASRQDFISFFTE